MGTLITVSSVALVAACVMALIRTFDPDESSTRTPNGSKINGRPDLARSERLLDPDLLLIPSALLPYSNCAVTGAGMPERQMTGRATCTSLASTTASSSLPT